MKKLCILILLTVSVIFAVHAEDHKVDKQTKEKPKINDTAIDISKITLTTDKGSEVKVKNLTCGVLRNLEKGEKQIVSYTSSNKPIYSQKWSRPEVEWGAEVPVIDGYIFGAFIAFGDFPEGEQLPVEIVDTPPVPIEVNGTKQPVMRQTYYLTKPHKRYPLITTFKKEEPQFKQFGKWKKEFYNNGKLLFSYTFELVKPTAEEIARNQVYEDYVTEAQKSNPPHEPEKKDKDKNENSIKPKEKQ